MASARELMEESRCIVEDIMNEEQESFDNKSEKWQEGEKGEEAQEIINNLESAIESIGSCEESCEEGAGYVDDIVNNQ